MATDQIETAGPATAAGDEDGCGAIAADAPDDFRESDCGGGDEGASPGVVGRRGAIRTGLAGLGGLAAAHLLAGGVPEAAAAPKDPGAGPAVTPDPLRQAVQRSGLAVEIVDFSRPPRTSARPAFALLNSLYHINDGSGRIFTNDSRGKLWELDRSTGAATLFLDLARLRGSGLVKNTRQTGLRSFAFHPDFSVSGRPGYRKFYTVSTERVAGRQAGVKVFSGPFDPIFDNVVCEWTADAGGRTTVASSRREVFRIAQYRTDHSTDQLMFDPNAAPGSENYGLLFMATGDGGSATPGDPLNMAQNTGLVLGKVLRVDPLRQGGGGAYRVPASNPFVGRRGFAGEIWAIGFRHPRNISFDAGGAGTFFISDIGQANIEEINIGVKGGNYGWSLREGTFVVDDRSGRTLYALPGDDARRNFVYPVLQYDHSEGKAVAGGFVYRGSAVPGLVGHYVFGDIVNGRVFHAPVSSLALGRQAEVKELTLLRGGRPTTMLQLVGTSQPPGRVDLAFGQDEAGEVYVLSKQDGVVRRLRAA